MLRPRRKILLFSIWYPPLPVFLFFTIVVIFGFFLWITRVDGGSRRNRIGCGNQTRKIVNCTNWQSSDPSFDLFSLFHHPFYFFIFLSHSHGCGGFSGCGFHIHLFDFGSVIRWNIFLLSVALLPLFPWSLLWLWLLMFIVMIASVVNDNNTIYCYGIDLCSIQQN